MRIAVFYELPEGGALKVINEMTRRLKKDHTVDLYTTSETKKFKYSSYYTNTYVYYFKQKKWNGKDWKARLYKDSVELLKLFLLHRKIAKEIRSRNYDILFVNGSKYIEAPFILNFKNKNKILYAHNTNYRFVYEPILNITKDLDPIRSLYERVNRFIRKNLDLINIKSADKIITGSKFEKYIIKKTYGLMSDSIPYGVDSDFFTDKKTNKRYDILFLGTTHVLEGYPTLLEVIEKLPKNIRVKKILGDIEWVTDVNELRNLYQSSKIVLCLGYNEPFGLTPLDAMSCGVPVIAVDEGGYKETVIDGVTGFLVPRDPEKIAEKIMLLLKNEKLLDRMGKKGREDMVSNWKWEKNVNKLNKLFNSMVSN